MLEAEGACRDLSEEDFVYAMREMSTYIDITAQDLLALFQLACKYADIRHAERVRVGNVMTRDVVMIRPDTSLAEAARKLLRHGIDGMPVVDSERRPVGMLTEADLLANVGLPCRHPSCRPWRKLAGIFAAEVRRMDGLAGTVREAMWAEPVTISDTARLQELIDFMKKMHVKRVIVTDDEGRVSGIVTRSNIVRAFVDAHPDPGDHDVDGWPEW
ncbi:MAG: CBS domain-containing protein [Gammaproteobacteria bacterium]